MIYDITEVAVEFEHAAKLGVSVQQHRKLLGIFNFDVLQWVLVNRLLF